MPGRVGTILLHDVVCRYTVGTVVQLRVEGKFSDRTLGLQREGKVSSDQIETLGTGLWAVAGQTNPDLRRYISLLSYVLDFPSGME